jgi:predicted nuclease of predicted toxin-antitoxin system
MKLLVDMNLSPRLTTLLKQSGLEATHWSQIGAANAPDPEIMAYAKANDFVILTHDLDHSAILVATNADKPSVVQIRTGDLTPETIAPPIIAAVLQCAEALRDGALLTIDSTRMRLKLLPLKSP